MLVGIVERHKYGLLASAMTILAIPALSGYLVGAPEQVFYLLVGLLSIRYEGRGRGGGRFGWLALLAGIGFILLAARILYLLSLVYFLLFLLEKARGRINDAPIYAAVLVWPAAQYVLHVMSFPLRLGMTASVGAVLRLFYPEIAVKGNIIAWAETEFVVAEACLGLSLLQTSLLICLFLIGRDDRQFQRSLSWPWIALALAVTTGLVMLANWVRILCTVLFKSMPDTAGHEIIGLLCLVLYVLFPLSQLIPLMGTKWAADVPEQGWADIRNHPVWALPVLFLLVFLIPGKFERGDFDPDISNLVVPGYSREVLENGVLRFADEEALVYLKPGVPFSASDHHPRICWQGSGYRFLGESQEEIGGHQVMVAKMTTPEGETWHSCWWYDNGTKQTISQWEWRRASLLTGQPFRLVNITCTERKALDRKVESWLRLMRSGE